MADSTVQIKLVTTADTSGAQQTTGAMDKVETGIKEVAQESNKTEKTIRELEAELRKTREALRDLTPSDARLPALRQEINQLEGVLGKAGVSGRNMGNALLQGSRGLQDMQYGLAGAVNNLEGIASALGMSAGVAGVVTVLAVAVQTLGPHVVQWFKSLDTEGKKLDELKTKLSAAATAILGEWTPASQAAMDASDAFTGKLSAEKAALDALEDSLKRGLELLRERNRLTADIGKNEDEAKIEDIKSKGLPKEEEARQIGRVKIERVNANKKSAEEELAEERRVATARAAAAEANAKQAEERRKKLEAEKRLSIRASTIDLEISGKKDADGKVIEKGAWDRVKSAEDNVAGAEKLRGMPGIDAKFAEEQRIKAQDELAREKERLARLEAEQKRNIEMNGGNAKFRGVDDIQKEIDQATPAAAAAAKKSEEARKAQADIEALQPLKQQKINSDYRRDADKVLKTLPPDSEQPKRVQHAEVDPFEIAQREKDARKPRNLAAEEAAGQIKKPGRDLAAEEAAGLNTRPRGMRDLAAEEAAGTGQKSAGRNLAAEEKNGAAKAMQELAEASRESDAALMDVIKKMTEEKKKMLQQMKNSRS